MIGFSNGKCRMCGKETSLNEGICSGHSSDAAQGYLFGLEDGQKQLQAEVDRLKATHISDNEAAWDRMARERDEALALAEAMRNALETISKGNCICGMCEVCALGLHGFAKQALALTAPEVLKRLRMEAVEAGLRVQTAFATEAALKQKVAAIVAKLEKGE